MIFLVRVFLLYLSVSGSNGFAEPAFSSCVVQRQDDPCRSSDIAAKKRSFGLRGDRSPTHWSSSLLQQSTSTAFDEQRRALLIPESLRNHVAARCRRRPCCSPTAASRQAEHDYHQRSSGDSFLSLPLLERFSGMLKSSSNTSLDSSKAAKQRRQKVLFGIMMVAASMLAGGRYGGLMRIGWTWSTQHYKFILRAAFAAAVIVAALDIVRTKRRQAVDPTSEWARYARRPVLRVLALCKLVVQVSVLSLLGKQQRLFPSLQARAGRCFADGLLRVGPLYIKLGQIISSQSSHIPKSWGPAMERLQDQVPAQSGEKARSLAYAAWPGGAASFDGTFESVDWTPVAAASLGQVHKATLRRHPLTAETTTKATTTGPAVVALKLQRPFLREIYNQDLALLMSLAKAVDRFLAKSAGSIGGVQQSWTNIFRNAQTILYREIDYVAEAKNTQRFNRDFGLAKDGLSSSAYESCTAIARNGKPLASAAAWLRAPHVYKELSSEKVLVMEFVPSIKVTKSEELDKAGLTAQDKEYLAQCLGRSYLRQLCCNKFFSTDPHAGNLGVETLDMTSTQPEKRVRLCFYDFGQVAELKQNQADGILEILEAIIDSDVDRSIKAFQQMGVLIDGADLDVVRAKVADNYRTGKIKAKKKGLKRQTSRQNDSMTASNKANTPNKVRINNDAQVMQYFTLPAEYAFVGRALAQMDGVGKSLDPEFDFVSASAPWFYEIKGADKYLLDEAVKKLDELKSKLCKLVGLGDEPHGHGAF